MSHNNVYILEDRAILYVSGAHASDFLQNLISNNIDKVTDISSCFTSLLTPQGKFLYEFIIVKNKLGYFLDCEKSQVENFKIAEESVVSKENYWVETALQAIKRCAKGRKYCT